MEGGVVARTIQLSAFDLILAAGLVVAAGLVSMALRLNLEKRLAVATVRMVVQLLLVGYILKVVFRVGSPLVLTAVIVVMVIFASRAAVRQSSRTFHGATWFAFWTLLMSGIVTTFSVTSLVINVEPWYEPRYVIPLLGMVFGNGMTGISLCLDYLLASFDEHRAEVETELALGATAWEAALRPLRAAVQRGMIPIVNRMMVAGVVALPGMMTGQILAGEDPLNAVKYQIVVMFMISAATTVGSVIAGLLVYRRLFNARHQLRVELIRKQG